MLFQENSLFHVYNQGNNPQTVFYEEKDYLDFLARMRKYLLPHVDLLAYCLMPNHFHFLVYVRQIDATFPITNVSFTGVKTTRYTTRSFNLSIGILLRSYTSYLNKKRETTGSVFRQKTKAKENWIDGFVTVDNPTFFGGNNYALTCFNYIHNNPKDIPSVKKLEDWPYSSYPDYLGIRNGTLCNKKQAKELIGDLPIGRR